MENYNLNKKFFYDIIKKNTLYNDCYYDYEKEKIYVKIYYTNKNIIYIYISTEERHKALKE